VLLLPRYDFEGSLNTQLLSQHVYLVLVNLGVVPCKRSYLRSQESESTLTNDTTETTLSFFSRFLGAAYLLSSGTMNQSAKLGTIAPGAVVMRDVMCSR